MSTSVFSLYYLPSVSYFARLVSAEKVLIEKHDNFQKSSYRNRTVINTANGTQLLSIPVVGGRDKHQLYRDVKISFAENWQKQHWQSIRSAYGSAPFFEHYADFIAPFYEKRIEWLFDFNWLLLEKMLYLFKVNRELHFTETFELNLVSYSRETKESATITTDFRDTSPEPKIAPYLQVFSHKNGFNPNVSVLDLLFCEGGVHCF